MIIWKSLNTSKILLHFPYISALHFNRRSSFYLYYIKHSLKFLSLKVCRLNGLGWQQSLQEFFDRKLFLVDYSYRSLSVWFWLIVVHYVFETRISKLNTLLFIENWMLNVISSKSAYNNSNVRVYVIGFYRCVVNHNVWVMYLFCKPSSFVDNQWMNYMTYILTNGTR